MKNNVTNTNKAKDKKSIRVLYKKVGQTPNVKIIDNVFKLKKAIINKNLQIIAYETVYIICNDKQAMNYQNLNIVLTLNSIYGDLLLVNIDKNKREFKGLSQEEIIWFTEDLINKSPISKEQIQLNKISKLFCSKPKYYTNEKYNSNFENKLISILTNIELLLVNLKKQ